MITRRTLFSAGGAAGLLLSGCATERPVPDGRFPILALLADDPQISDFYGALRRSGLDDLLRGNGPFTVLAPTNAAWAAAPPAMRAGQADALRNLIANGRLRLPDIQARNGTIRMLSGIEVRVVGGSATQPRIQAAAAGRAPSGASASIVRPNLLASNGVIHVVDAVLFPA